MKQETKELIRWINTILNEHKRMLAELKEPVEPYDAKRKKVIKFLNSLPEIESHLCNGGYIQDRNGTPCCDGDKVKVKDIEYTLYWSKSDGCFYMRPTVMPDFLERLSINFEKVEK